MFDLTNQIDVLVRARYPILYLISYEEDRATRILQDLATRRSKQFLKWSIVKGMVSSGNPKGDERTRDPMQALDFVLKCQEPAIFMLSDFDPYLKDTTVVRQLREVALSLKTTHKTVCIVSPVLELPRHLEKDITVLDLALPTFDELAEKFDSMVAQIQRNPNVCINMTPELREQLVKAAQGLTLQEAENVFARAVVLDGTLGEDDVSTILSEKKQIIRKSGLLEFYEAQEALADIGGLENLKRWLTNRRLAFSDKARAFGLPEPKGILLIGIQGCGKSLTAKAVSGLWRLPLLRLDVGSVFSGVVGSSEENIRRAIRVAESVSPCVLWLDELDKGFSGIQSSNFSDAGTTARVFGSFITWLQEKTVPVFVIATANNIQALPPELLRKGRFDEIFFVDLPNDAERKEIFRIHLKRRKRSPDKYDLDALSRLAADFSGAEIEQAVISALYAAFELGRDLEQNDLERALRETVPLAKTMEESISELREWSRTRARSATAGETETASLGARSLEF